MDNTTANFSLQAYPDFFDAIVKSETRRQNKKFKASPGATGQAKLARE